MYGRPFACIFCARPDRLAGQPVQESTSICNKPLVLEVYPGNKSGNRRSALRLPPSALETGRIGGQNEIADWIHVGDGLPGAVYGGAVEGTEPERRAKVRPGQSRDYGFAG